MVVTTMDSKVPQVLMQKVMFKYIHKTCSYLPFMKHEAVKYQLYFPWDFNVPFFERSIFFCLFPLHFRDYILEFDWMKIVANIFRKLQTNFDGLFLILRFSIKTFLGIAPVLLMLWCLFFYKTLIFKIENTSAELFMSNFFWYSRYLTKLSRGWEKIHLIKKFSFVLLQKKAVLT